VSLVVHNLTGSLRGHCHRRQRFIFATLTWLSLVIQSHSAHAEQSAVAAEASDDGLPLALLTATTVQRGKSALVTSLDKEIRTAVAEHAPVHLIDGAPKKLSSFQAAAHCRDEAVECLRAIAAKAGVEVVLSPSLERGSGELTLSFLAYDARMDAITRVAHWQDGSEITPETHDALPSLIGALFPEPGPPDMDFVAEAEAASQPAVVDASGQPVGAGPSLLPPLLVAGGGVALIGAGLLTGMLLQSTQADYDAADIETRQDAEAADALHAKASTQASVANIFYGLGSVALVASGAWLAVEIFGAARDSDRGERARTRVRPWVAPQSVGVVVRHQGGLF